MAQKRTNAELSSIQRKVAEMLVDPSFLGNISELCEKCGVSRSTFYRWRDQPDFCDYVDSLIDKYTDAELAGVWKALIKSCLQGNVPAMRLFFELKNKFKQEGKAAMSAKEDDPQESSFVAALTQKAEEVWKDEASPKE